MATLLLLTGIIGLIVLTYRGHTWAGLLFAVLLFITAAFSGEDGIWADTGCPEPVFPPAFFSPYTESAGDGPDGQSNSANQ